MPISTTVVICRIHIMTTHTPSYQKIKDAS
jgi:hypothetical protein